MSAGSRTAKPQEDEPGSDAERRIRERAHMLWEIEGKQDGRDDEYWHRARELIADENNPSFPPTQSRGHRA
jgi:hypothetical protein